MAVFMRFNRPAATSGCVVIRCFRRKGKNHEKVMLCSFVLPDPYLSFCIDPGTAEPIAGFQTGFGDRPGSARGINRPSTPAETYNESLSKGSFGNSLAAQLGMPFVTRWRKSPD